MTRAGQHDLAIIHVDENVFLNNVIEWSSFVGHSIDIDNAVILNIGNCFLHRQESKMTSSMSEEPVEICRFCWHRIRTDENGLCPACRKQYPEDPAEFKALTEDELQRIKKERKQKDLQRKQKAAENRKHLANVRVVQKNLVFVVGLSKKLAEPEILKKQEYFGKFGKIHKVVINQSTSYAGSQVKGPSASAYVTYNRCEDALRAILAVNNVHVDGRTLKASLGTTKYCSHFLRGSQCPKQDCMYLHELGEDAASFTKEEMQMGKHQEYEQNLLEQFMNSQNTANSQMHSSNSKPIPTRKKNTSPITITPPSGNTPPQPQISPGQTPQQPQPPNTSNKEAWPSLKPGNKTERHATNGNRPNHKTDNSCPVRQNNRIPTKSESESEISNTPPDSRPEIQPPSSVPPQTTQLPLPGSGILPPHLTQNKPVPPRLPMGLGLKGGMFDNPAASLSLFSGNGFHGVRNQKLPVPTQTEVPESIPTTEIPESIQVSSCTDWQAAFGFTSKSREVPDDDLGFDPWDESAKGLADLIEKETKTTQAQRMHLPNSQTSQTPQNLPPGFSLSHIQQQQQNFQHPAFLRQDLSGSRMMGFIQPNTTVPPKNSFIDAQSKDQLRSPQNDVFSTKDWQDGLRALLPNINISFGGPPGGNLNSLNHSSRMNPAHSQQQQQQQKSNSVLTDSTPHWLKSIHQLTEIESHTPSNRLPFSQQFPPRNTYMGWPSQNPPPGFQSQIRPPQHTEPHKLTEERRINSAFESKMDHGIQVKPKEDLNQADRLNTLRKTCQTIDDKMPKGTLSDAKVRSHFIYDKKTKLIFCDLPKVGSTFLKQVLHILMGHRKVEDPFKITGNEAHGIPFNTFASLPVDEMVPLLMDSFKVVFVRDPYSRIVSGYVDKIFTNNYVFWDTTGKLIIREQRENATIRSKQCGSDVKFEEFVRHIYKSEKEVKHRNPHWYPMSDSCRPCNMRFNFIGKIETFKSDITDMLKALNATQKVHISSMDQKNDEEAISLTVRRAFDVVKKRPKCVTLIQALERAWKVLQIRGVIHFASTFPYEYVYSKKKIDQKQFTNVIRDTIAKLPLSKEDKNKVRREVIYKAYSRLSEKDLKKFQDIFSLDFRLFGYDLTPPEFSVLGEEGLDWNPFDLEI
ncbi:hypothetical protein FSP39_018178 [Pinctada imbricata]|uniref:Carbohydrate sulfotransferase n=1 Tax=Pinctada imbricata TaxID=66713 RepID=A0AA88YPV2_PINIB|nr:hypothetical protein FSP39_018178 [Pinctada imbricata]